jgi:hypothetical protein
VDLIFSIGRIIILYASLLKSRLRTANRIVTITVVARENIAFTTVSSDKSKDARTESVATIVRISELRMLVILSESTNASPMPSSLIKLLWARKNPSRSKLDSGFSARASSCKRLPSGVLFVSSNEKTVSMNKTVRMTV